MTVLFFMSALPIFPVRRQTSIFGRSELNFRVRNGNGWTLALINTDFLSRIAANIDRFLPAHARVLTSSALRRFSQEIVLSHIPYTLKTEQ